MEEHADKLKDFYILLDQAIEGFKDANKLQIQGRYQRRNDIVRDSKQKINDAVALFDTKYSVATA